MGADAERFHTDIPQICLAHVFCAVSAVARIVAQGGVAHSPGYALLADKAKWRPCKCAGSPPLTPPCEHGLILLARQVFCYGPLPERGEVQVQPQRCSPGRWLRAVVPPRGATRPVWSRACPLCGFFFFFVWPRAAHPLLEELRPCNLFNISAAGTPYSTHGPAFT